MLTRAVTYPEKWAIVAPSHNKARIIMGYIIDHLFDNPLTEAALQTDKSESGIKRLQQERSKNRLTFRVGEKDGKPLMSEVFVLSGDSRNKLNAGDAIMGFGAPNVILDEAALVDDIIESKIFRMLGDSMDNFYLKIGNPFRRNHFLKSNRDPNYYKMNIDYPVGLAEGRVTEEFIEEARQKPNFEVLYENKFPEADTVDDQGYTPLLMEAELERAFDTIPVEAILGVPRLSVDVARGGGNFNVWEIRWQNYARILAKNKDSDTMSVATTTMRLAREHSVEAFNTFIDDNGVGGGVTDRLHQLGFYSVPVKAQEKADVGDEEEMFVNRRAQNYWRMRQWIIDGGKLEEKSKGEWLQILDIKYKAMDNRKIQIMPKIQMQRNGIESPDSADALAQSFDRIYTFDKNEQDHYKDGDDFNPNELM